jgi:signal peptidase I
MIDNRSSLPVSSEPKQKKEMSSFLIELIETLLLSVLLFLAINIATSRILVQSISMQPTLFERDRVLVNRLAYKFGHPSRKDIIVFIPPVNGGSEPYIKRVIGLPGEDIRVVNGHVIVNGEILDETYIEAPPDYTGSWTIPQGQLFVLGDNRNYSSDSHYWGTIPIENVIGKAEFIYWPASHLKALNTSSAIAAGSPSP